MSFGSQTHRGCSSITHNREVAVTPGETSLSRWSITENECDGQDPRTEYGLQNCQPVDEPMRGEIHRKMPRLHNFAVAVMSWTISGIADGMAAYGQAMYPPIYFDSVGIGTDDNSAAPGHVPSRHDHADDMAITFCSHANQADFGDQAGAVTQEPRTGVSAPVFEHSSRSIPLPAERHGWRVRIWSQLAGLASRLRREWEIRQETTDLDALDDRALKDIGLSRYDTVHLARNRRRIVTLLYGSQDSSGRIGGEQGPRQVL
jgi:uncharacterized protein YjiS (DUF1127 family)